MTRRGTLSTLLNICQVYKIITSKGRFYVYSTSKYYTVRIRSLVIIFPMIALHDVAVAEARWVHWNLSGIRVVLQEEGLCDFNPNLFHLW